MTDDIVHDGTGLPPEDTTEPEQTPDTTPEGSQTAGDGPPYEGGTQDGPATDTVTEGQDAVAGSLPEEIPGELVSSDTAGTGEAVNADTGEVTTPGDPLPEIPADTDGTPLEPAQDTPQADAGTSQPEPTP